MITFFLVGCGRIGERHASYMQAFGRISAVCDTDKVKADALAAKYSAKAYYHLDDYLLDAPEADVAAVCTPNGLHALHSIRLMQAGMHVLCEKPMAIRVADCRQMIAVSEQTGKKLFIVKQNRFNPPVQVLKQILDSKRLGKVYSLQLNCFWNRDAGYYQNSWKGSKDLDGGTLFTQFSHFIDILYWLIGDLQSSQAVLSNYAHKGIIEFEDTGVVLLQFKNGVTGTLNYTVNSHNKNMEGSITLFAEKGTIKIGGQYLNKIEYCNIENYVLPDIPGGNAANDYGIYQGSMSNHDKVYKNLVHALDGTAPMYMSAVDAMQTVAIIEQIYKNAVRL